MILIPTISTGELFEYTFHVSLDNVVYRLRLSWNGRMDHWILSVYALDETPIVQGRMVVNGIDLLRGCVVEGRPPGQLFAVPTDRKQEHAGLTGLGSRVQLYYRPEAEL